MPRHIGVGADPHAGRTTAPKHAILLKHGHSRMLAFSPARRARPHVKGARRVQRGGRFLMCSACAMPKKSAAFSRASVRVGGSFIRPMQTAQTTSRQYSPQAMPCYIKLPCCRSRITASLLRYPKPYPGYPKRYPAGGGEHHCQAGHFPLHAKTGHRKSPMTCFPLCRRLPIFPGRFQPSIFGASELNCRVRDGNGCTLTAISTDYISTGFPPDDIRFRVLHTLKTE